MLQFILGKSGSGKTTEAVNILADKCKKGDKKLLMLVPDQSSFETETTFLDILGAKLSGNVLVFGFSRLSNFVFKNTGNIPENVIDDGVRKILMSKAIEETSDSLEMFTSSKTRKSVLDLMIHSLKECKKDNITPDMLENTADLIENETLKKKLSETALVLNAYEALLEKSYVDPLENLNRLKDILETERIFEGYTIVVDSFSGFTYQQLEIIRILLTQSKDFYITVNIDMEYKNSEIFETTERTRKLVKRLAQSNGIEIKPDIILNNFYRSEKSDISFLENNVLRINDKIYSEKAENIETYEAFDVYDEVNFTARRIKSLVVDKGYKYRDIAIILRDNNIYNGILDTVLEKYSIPYFMDIPQDVFTNPIIRFVSGILDIAISNFDRDSLISTLKTGLFKLSDTQIADFENYIYVWNIDRSGFKKEFKNNPSGFETLSDYDFNKLSEIEATRKYIVNPLVDFINSTKDTDGTEISKALYRLIEQFEINDSIDKLYDSLESEGLVFEANEQVRVYNLMIESLDKLTAVLGDVKISLQKYRDYLRFKLSDIKVSDIPRYQDQISVAVADRVRLSDAKAVFVLGAVDGLFPSIPQTAGVFSETERRILIENNIPLTDSLEQLASHEKYLIYCALTSASDKVFVTTYSSDFSGEDYEPSVFYNDIVKMFPHRNDSKYSDYNEKNELYSKQQAFEYLSKKFNIETPDILALKQYFKNDEDYMDNYIKLENTLNKKPFRINDSKVSEELFRKNMSISASRIEKYNLCPFQYFCNYGLKAKERKTAEIDSIQFGNIVHYFLEKFLKENNKAVLNTLSDDSIKKSIDRILLEYAEETFGGLEDKTDNFRAMFERLKINIFVLIKELIRQLMYSDFIPTDYELRIGSDGSIPPYKIQLDNDRSVSVNGFIDRVDKYDKNDDESYIRIVDYKTGNKQFKLYEILYGINLQMLLYLRCVIENGKEYFGKDLIPAGILYMPSAAKDIDGDKYPTDEKINAQIDSHFRMNGLVLSDSDVLEHMDRLGKFIKLSKKLEDGKYSDTTASKEQFNIIFKHIDDVVRSMGEELLGGNIEAKPIKGVVDGCAYCPYDSVCLHTYEDDYKYRTEASAKEVYTKLEKGDETNA